MPAQTPHTMERAEHNQVARVLVRCNRIQTKMAKFMNFGRMDVCHRRVKEGFGR